METTMNWMLSYIFFLVKGISYEKWLLRLFNPDGTDQPQWLMDYIGLNIPEALGVLLAGESVEELDWIWKRKLYLFKKRCSNTSIKRID
jgi:hypothetical protein